MNAFDQDFDVRYYAFDGELLRKLRDQVEPDIYRGEGRWERFVDHWDQTDPIAAQDVEEALAHHDDRLSQLAKNWVPE